MDTLAQFAFLFNSETGRLNPYACPITFTMGVVFAQALICGSVSAYMSVNRGLSGIHWFWMGFALSVVGIVLAKTRPAANQPFAPKHLGKTPSTHEPISCPGCGHPTHPSARTCSACGAALAPTITSETSIMRGAAAD